MKLAKSLVFLAAIAAAIAVAGDGAWAQQVPKFEQTVTVEAAPVAGSTTDHFLTFSGPFALPGVSLGPGTYVFRRAASGVLQVLNANRGQTYVYLFTIPITRGEKLDQYEARFAEPFVAGAPLRMTAWFTPGSSTGQELLYGNPELPGEEK